MILPDDDLIEIPIDEMQLGHDEDGLPKSEPGTKPATGKPIEAEADAPVERKRTPKAEPAIDPAELSEARRAAVEAKAEAARERAEREKAEKALDTRTGQGLEAHRRAVKAEYWQTATEHQHITSSLASTKDSLAEAKRNLKAAHEAQDGERIADLTEHIGTLSSYVTSLDQGRHSVAAREAEAKKAYEETEQYFEAARTAEAKKPAVVEDKPSQPTPDQWIAQFPRKTQSWLKANKDYVTDPDKHLQLQDFANEWVSDYGKETLHSPQFIEALNERFVPQTEVEEASVAETEPEVVEVQKPEPRKSQPAAPVSRSASPGRPSGSGGTIKLTQDQHAMAPQLYTASDYEGFDPEVKRRFPQWSENAARFQYHADLRRAEKDGKHLKLRA